MTDFNSADDFAQWLEDNDHNNTQGVPLLYPDEVYVAFVTIHGFYSDDPDDYISDAEEAYHGEFDSDEDFAESLASDLGMIQENAEWPNNYIDWERAARDLMMDYSEQDRYYFRNL